MRRVEVAEVARVAAEVGELPMDRGCLRPGVQPEDPGAAALGPDQAQEHPDRGGLAGAVRAQEAEDLALVDVGLQVDDAAALAIPPGQAAQLDRLGHAAPPIPRAWVIRRTDHKRSRVHALVRVP